MKNTAMLDIEKLLGEHPFELLDTNEREAVLAQMPEWEYQRLHQLLIRSKVALKKAPLPDPAIRGRLMDALRQQPKPQPANPLGLLVRLTQYRLPVWQAAAGLALLVTAHFALQKPPTEALRTETVYVNTTDTIYKEVAIPVVETPKKTLELRVNVKPRLAPASSLAPTQRIEALSDSSSNRNPSRSTMPDTLPGFRLTIQSPNGRSANEMKELWQFLGEVY